MPTELLTQAPERAFILKGWHVLAITIGFFAVIGGVNGFMITQALRTMPGADVKSAYEASQRFNVAIAEASVINAHQITGAISTEGSRIIVDPHAADGTAISGLTMTAALAHPADKSRDLDLPLSETSPGHYETAAAIPHGSWNVEISAMRGSETVFKADQRLMIEKAR